MKFLGTLTLFAASIAIQSAPAQTLPELAVRGLDPVELCSGKEVAGLEAITAAKRRYLYRFASEANLAVFQKEPDRYCIQLGGGCGRMGPLSGIGDPTRFAVHDGRIYIFASDSCRSGFLANPTLHVELDDPVATGSEEEAATATELLQRAVDAVGGASRLDAIRTLHFRDEREQDYEGKKVSTGSALLLSSRGLIRSETWWGEYRSQYDTSGSRGTTRQVARASKTPTEWELDGSQTLALRKIALRETIALLAVRARKGFVAFAGPEREFEGKQERAVVASFAGVTTSIWIEAESGRVTGCSYRGRLGSSPAGDVELRFSDFREVGGLTLPFVRKATFNGKESSTRTWSQVTVDDPADKVTAGG